MSRSTGVTAQFVWWIRTGGARQRWCNHGQHMRARAAPQRRLHLHYPPGAHGLRGTGPWRRATTTQRRQPAQITCRTTQIRPAHHAEAEESGGQPVAQLLREPAGHGLGGTSTTHLGSSVVSAGSRSHTPLMSSAVPLIPGFSVIWGSVMGGGEEMGSSV